MNTAQEQDTVRQSVRAHYGAIAERADQAAAAPGGCGCAPSSCCAPAVDTDYTTQLGYSAAETAAAPDGANLNLGCGNPVAVASIRPGETVLDLGSGAGFDAFIAAREVGASGRVIGVDMTPAMISKARRNAARVNAANVEFRLGEIEALPVADGTVDLVISNCVINLSPDQPRVLREAFRVLKSGGRLSISDIVARQPVPADWLTNEEMLCGCISGAETMANLERWLADAGFVDIAITPREQSKAFIDTWVGGKNLGEFIVSAIIAARKP